jgi:hypothetical protein
MLVPGFDAGTLGHYLVRDDVPRFQERHRMIKRESGRNDPCFVSLLIQGSKTP